MAVAGAGSGAKIMEKVGAEIMDKVGAEIK